MDQEPEPSVRRWLGVVRLTAVVALLATVVAVGYVVVVRAGPPSEEDLRQRAGLIGKQELLIGVHDDNPGVSLLDADTGVFSGFDIDIAYLVAADLGFRRTEVRLLPIESEDRGKMQARTSDNRFVTVDLVVASYSITEEREDSPGVTFSEPYLRTEQSVVTRRDHGVVNTYDDLRGRKVCSISTSTSESPAAQAGVVPANRLRTSQCIEDLLAGRVEAVTQDAALLAGFVARDPQRLKLHDIGQATEEYWGINTGANTALRDLVNLALYDSLHDPADRRWEDAFDRHLRPAQPASLPQQVAVDRQPDARRVDVRRWPWEWSALAP
ncbi:amino acid ABC transporter substrate-binding protein, PAAT family [Micromonospora pallida]|uniref:Amino acid ABC transporter substrate-binding protein, PAAT family n=1 Tax=Micromonospora pallida TaxID=145854 RepID=A0A1C6SBR7_9ACTN|nr:transporter substrate-binding domain-containing protein [Micromonospora pallida]SCL26879.1 amino acid ABC transporter substrate-binding protein, PAAT family [Micromonospora pallida]